MQSRNHRDAPEPTPDTLLGKRPPALALRRARVGVAQARRLLSWAVEPARWQRPSMAYGNDPCGPGEVAVYQREIALERTDPGMDPVLERGKRVNLAIAAPHFDGLLLSPEVSLSFWRVLGRCTRPRGYRHGMELRGGCIVPTLGGGLCLLSNALFQMACELGWTIAERHGHTMEAVPPSDDAVWGLDATVFWPHVDLRIAPREGSARLEVVVVDRVLRIRVHADRPTSIKVELGSAGDTTYQRDGVRWRANRVIRSIYSRAGGEFLYQDVVADNRRRLLHSEDMRRNCLTCEEAACHARPRDLAPISLMGG